MRKNEAEELSKRASEETGMEWKVEKWGDKAEDFFVVCGWWLVTFFKGEYLVEIVDNVLHLYDSTARSPSLEDALKEAREWVIEDIKRLRYFLTELPLPEKTLLPDTLAPSAAPLPDGAPDTLPRPEKPS